ncbi:MAG: galactose mutarotase [Pirellulales bacterium]|nr:galactose mutarotase [Pirellulales bacterium]
MAVLVLLGGSCVCLVAEEPPDRSPRVEKTVFGHLPDGSQVDLYTLANFQGLEARVITCGATLVGVRAPDRHGNADDITLHLETLDEYLRGHPLLGSVVGRFANRIAGARFTIDGIEYRLEANAGKNHIHGGGKKTGFQWQLWHAEPLRQTDSAGVTLSLVSPDGQAGYPGTLRATVVYRVTERNELVIQYEATSDKPTHVNLTNHAYWNLAGAGSGEIEMRKHVLLLNADHYLPADEAKVPTGEIRAVRGTPMDFTTSTPIGSRIDQVDRGDYDHCYVLHGDAGKKLALAASVVHSGSGRTMEVYTTQPGVQLYTGNRGGFCLETQHFPNSPNESKFPSTLLRPGENYRETTVHRFGVQR